jgi:ribonuclease Z
VHTNTRDLAAIEQESDVEHLLRTHLIPPVPDVMPARKAFTSGMSDRYDGPITVACDGMEIRLD